MLEDRQRQVTGQRITALDALRGFALTGIVLVNAQDLLDVRTPAGASAIVDGLNLFVQGRFFPIFGFLFGVGMAIFLTNAERRGDRPYLLMVRRLGALLVLGIAHHLLQPGEVLIEYAVVGLVVMWAHRVRPVILLPLAVSLTVAVGIVASGPLVVPALFLLGMAVGRTDLWRHSERYRRGYAVAFGVSAVGSAAVLLLVPAARGDARFDQWAGAVGLLMSVGYASGLLLVLSTATGRVLSRILAPFGRMALTNYITQTVLLVLVHATLLRGAVSPSASLLAATGVLLVQIPASTWWLSRYPQGPLEWVWRKATYGGTDAGRVNDQPASLVR